MSVQLPSPEKISIWEAEAHHRYPNLAMVLQFREASYAWEYSLHFAERDPTRKMNLPPLMRTEPLWFPMEMFWREDGSTELEFLFSLFPGEDTLDLQLANLHSVKELAVSIALCLTEAVATGFTAFWGSLCVVWSSYLWFYPLFDLHVSWGFDLTGWVPLLLSGALQIVAALPTAYRSKLQTALWISGGIGGIIGTLLSVEASSLNEFGSAFLLLSGLGSTGISLLICMAWNE
jgi:hypothetical protein